MKSCHLVLMTLLLTAPRVAAADPVVFDVPGSIRTEPMDINDRGDIVGSFTTADDRVHGFLYSKGEFTIIDAPDAVSTVVTGVNNRGDMVGVSSPYGGFALRAGVFERLLSPAGNSLSPTDINNRGDIVGSYINHDLIPPFGPPFLILFVDGFLLDARGNFTSIDTRGSIGSGADHIEGINDARQMVGAWTNLGLFGPTSDEPFLVDKDGDATFFVLPGTVLPPQQHPRGINNAGHIVGSVVVSPGLNLGFDLRNGSATFISIPGASFVSAYVWSTRT
jgi:probable HAF family extracellular repeat protein